MKRADGRMQEEQFYLELLIMVIAWLGGKMFRGNRGTALAPLNEPRRFLSLLFFQLICSTSS